MSHPFSCIAGDVGALCFLAYILLFEIIYNFRFNFKGLVGISAGGVLMTDCGRQLLT